MVSKMMIDLLVGIQLRAGL